MKRTEKLMDAMTYMDDTMIEETLAVRTRAQAGTMTAQRAVTTKETEPTEVRWRKRQGRRVIKIGAAACVCVALLGGIWVLDHGEEDTLPVLDISDTWESRGLGGGDSDGIYGITAADDRGNPWDKNMELTSLPVFKNLKYLLSGVATDGLSEEQMEQKLYDTAEKLNVEVNEVSSQSYEQNELPYTLNGYGEKIRIEVYGNGQVSVDVLPPWKAKESYNEGEGILKLPEDLSGDVTDEDKARKIMNFLAKEYEELLNFSDPQKITYAETDLNGTKQWHFIIYDKGRDYEEDLLNYNFQKAEFYVENGWVTFIRIDDYLSVMEEIGDYPLISEKEAEEKLMKGEYESGIGGKYPFDEDDVESVELLYVNGLGEYVIPYYVFHVRYDYDGAEEEAEFYHDCYVPAIEDKYIESGLYF